MPDTSKRAVQAFAIVAIPLMLAGGVIIATNKRSDVERRYQGGPYPEPGYWDGAWRDRDSGQPLAKDDPRLNFYHDAQRTKEGHDKALRENPNAFAPPTFPDKYPPSKATQRTPPKYGS